MKVAVYTIALNERQFAERWANSAIDADYRFVLDTGSTDGTVEVLQELGVSVAVASISPWRFDDARNASLALLPDDMDYCIALDMDEVLVPGWKEKLQEAHDAGATRPRYKYTWSWTADGKPGLQYGGDKIHSRHGYRWKHPVHEVITTDRLKEKQHWVGLEIHHYPDNSKPRSQYLPLLQQSVIEQPNDDRNAFYYARELFFYNEYEKAVLEFKRHLALPTATWPAERAASYRYLAKCDSANTLSHLKSAIKEDPSRRESIVELALYYYRCNDFQNCYWACLDAIKIADKPLDYLCEEFAWGELPYDLAAISAYNLGFKEEAIKYGKIASDLKPEDSRLSTNLGHYLSIG